MAKADVPDNTGVATRPALALAIIERVIASDVTFSWVAADSVYGVGNIEVALRRAAKGYVLGVSANHRFHLWSKPLAVAGTAKDIAAALPEGGWHRRAAGEGTRGARWYDRPISNWPTSMPMTSRPATLTRYSPASGPAAC